jgi:hypothetical protein
MQAGGAVVHAAGQSPNSTLLSLFLFKQNLDVQKYILNENFEQI